MNTITSALFLALYFCFLSAPQSMAQQALPQAPTCYGEHHQVLSNSNARVVSLKQTTQNLYKEQAFVQAHLVKMLAVVVNSYGHHEHFIVSLGEPSSPTFLNKENLIEIADSLNDYSAPSADELSKGPIYLCGEYNTADAAKTPQILNFSPSVTGAIIHWTHLAGPNVDGNYSHPNGWVYVNGKLYGTALGKQH